MKNNQSEQLKQDRIKYLRKVLKTLHKYYIKYKQKRIWGIEIWANVVYLRFVVGRNTFISHKKLAIIMQDSNQFDTVKGYIGNEFKDFKLEKEFKIRMVIIPKYPEWEGVLDDIQKPIPKNKQVQLC